MDLAAPTATPTNVLTGYGGALISPRGKRGWDREPGYEAKWAAGQTKFGGKHVPADGLVSRRGYRRVFPGITQEEREWLEVPATSSTPLLGSPRRGLNTH